MSNTPLVSALVLVYASAPREATGADVANMAFSVVETDSCISPSDA
jgi:hypothetical protein